MVVFALIFSSLAFLTVLVSAIWLIVIAFRESTSCGLMYLFIPFYSIYYIVTRWSNVKKPFLIFLLGLSCSFIFLIILDWGRQTKSFRPKTNVIGEINGEQITHMQFELSYHDRLDAYRKQYINEPTETELDSIRNEVWESLTRNILFKLEIKRRKITVSNEELKDVIFNNPPDLVKRNPDFTDANGKFDKEKYDSALRDPKMDTYWRRLEDYLRETMPLQKLQEEIKSEMSFTPDEINDKYDLQQKQQELMNSLYKKLKQKAKIKDYRKQYY